MNLYGICLVKNEDDIIESSLSYAAFHCTKVFVIDNGSTDNTWQIVKNLAEINDRIVPYKSTTEPFRNGLRAYVYNEFHTELNNDDWWLILDADEFLAEDPHPLIEAANRSQSDIINAWQIQFYYTEKDYADWLYNQTHSQKEQRHIIKRLRYYKINRREPRLFRNKIDQHWDSYSETLIPSSLKKFHKHNIYNRKYTFRTPEQLKKQLAKESNNKTPSMKTTHEEQWLKSYIKNSKELNSYEHGKAWEFSLVDRYQFFKEYYLNRLTFDILGTKARPTQDIL